MRYVRCFVTIWIALGQCGFTREILINTAKWINIHVNFIIWSDTKFPPSFVLSDVRWWNINIWEDWQWKFSTLLLHSSEFLWFIGGIYWTSIVSGTPEMLQYFGPPEIHLIFCFNKDRWTMQKQILIRPKSPEVYQDRCQQHVNLLCCIFVWNFFEDAAVAL